MLNLFQPFSNMLASRKAWRRAREAQARVNSVFRNALDVGAYCAGKSAMHTIRHIATVATLGAACE
jgi:hypothetical protein